MKRFSIILVVFFICACQLVVDIDVPFDGEQLVVNSFFKPDSLWSASISLNQFILTPDSIPHKRVENATVTIYDENGPVATLQHVGNGSYRSQTEKPLVGKQYTIHVSAPNYAAVEAKSVIPIAAMVESIETEFAIIENEPKEIIKVKFKDQGDTKDFYHIRLERVEEYYDLENDQVISHFVPHDDVISDNPELNSQYISADGGLLVKDVLFNGKQAEVRMMMMYGYNPSYFAGIRIVLRSVSEDYYNYVATKNLQHETSGNPFAQPVKVYNNVTNGFGIFAGISSSSFDHYYPHPIITDISPVSGKVGDIITITGQNFEIPNSPYTPDVSFKSTNGFTVHGNVIELSDTQLKVVVPINAASGKLVVRRVGSITVSDTEFEVIN